MENYDLCSFDLVVALFWEVSALTVQYCSPNSVRGYEIAVFVPSALSVADRFQSKLTKSCWR